MLLSNTFFAQFLSYPVLLPMLRTSRKSLALVPPFYLFIDRLTLLTRLLSADLDDIYMLGTHPCRSLRLVGLVVAIWEPDSGRKSFITCQPLFFHRAESTN